MTNRRRVAISRDAVGGLRAIGTEILAVLAIAAVTIILGFIGNLIF